MGTRVLNETATTVAAFRPIREPTTNFFQNHAPGNNNYELVVREGDALRHYWFDYPSGQWNRGQSVGSNISGDPAIFQNHSPGNNNYELVVHESFARGNRLQHYWFDYSSGQWNRGQSFGSIISGDPAMFQNHAPGNNNYELVVRESVPRRGSWLQHYWFDYPSGQWNRGQRVGSLISGGPAMFQNRAPGNNNYELVVRDRDALRHYWYDGQWNRGQSFGSNTSGDPAMFQNRAPGNNNYELVVREGDALRHYWYDGQWNVFYLP